MIVLVKYFLTKCMLAACIALLVYSVHDTWQRTADTSLRKGEEHTPEIFIEKEDEPIQHYKKVIDTADMSESKLWILDSHTIAGI